MDIMSGYVHAFSIRHCFELVCHALARSNQRRNGIGNSRLRRPSFDLLSSGTEQSKESNDSKRGSRKLNNNSNDGCACDLQHLIE